MSFNFHTQKKAGKSGEDLFALCYPEINPSPADDLSYDFNSDIGKIEVKTDTYSMLKTPNFFLERYGCSEKRQPGGPWRSLKDGVDYFVYFFVDDLTFFWFKPKAFCKFLDKHTAGLKMKEIKNKSWITLGHAFPREKCAHLYRADTFKLKGKKYIKI